MHRDTGKIKIQPKYGIYKATVKYLVATPT